MSFSRCALLLTESSDMQCGQMSTTQKRPIFRLKIHFVQEEMAIIIDSLNGWGWFLKLFLINLRIFCMDYLETHPFRKKKSYIMSFETVIIVVFSFGIMWKIIENRHWCFYLRSWKQWRWLFFWLNFSYVHRARPNAKRTSSLFYTIFNLLCITF